MAAQPRGHQEGRQGDNDGGASAERRVVSGRPWGVVPGCVSAVAAWRGLVPGAGEASLLEKPLWLSPGQAGKWWPGAACPPCLDPGSPLGLWKCRVGHRPKDSSQAEDAGSFCSPWARGHLWPGNRVRGALPGGGWWETRAHSGQYGRTPWRSQSPGALLERKTGAETEVCGRPYDL